MDIISQLCAIILQFHDQICLQSWTVAKGTATHPAYPAIADTINLFNKLSAFLYQGIWFIQLGTGNILCKVIY